MDEFEFHNWNCELLKMNCETLSFSKRNGLIKSFSTFDHQESGINIGKSGKKKSYFLSPERENSERVQLRIN